MRITEVVHTHTRILQLGDVGEEQIQVGMVVEKERLLRQVGLARHDVANFPLRRAQHLMGSRCDSLQEEAEDASAAAPVTDLDLPLPIVQGHHGALEVPLELLHLGRRDSGHNLPGQPFAESGVVQREVGGVLRLFYVFLCFCVLLSVNFLNYMYFYVLPFLAFLVFLCFHVAHFYVGPKGRRWA